MGYRELKPDELVWNCDVKCIELTKENIEKNKKIIGQKRAVEALEVGLDINSIGYNIFVTGAAGTGRTTAVKLLIDKSNRKKQIPTDKCYVNNFRNPDSPRLIVLPMGMGRKFKKNVEENIGNIIKNIPIILESEQHREKRNTIIEIFKKKEQDILAKFESRVAKQGFAVVQVQVGPFTKPDLFPVYKEKPVNFEQVRALARHGKISDEDVKRMQETYNKLSIELEKTIKKLSNIKKEANKEMMEVDRKTLHPFIQEVLSDIKEKYNIKAVEEFLKEVEESIMENRGKLLSKNKPNKDTEPYLEYQVNLIVDNSNTKKAPVIFEASPTFKNLFGSIERKATPAGWVSDYRNIKAGSLLRADCGFLIMNALDVLIEPGVWNALKRTLKTRRLEIQTYDTFFMLTLSALKPEPIDIDVKVILIGEPFIYHLLYHRDDDFKKIFKIRADFDWVMPNKDESVTEYAVFVSTLQKEEALLKFSKDSIARIVEYGVRLAGKQKKLSTRFNHIADILREANYLVRKKGKKMIKREDIDQAIDKRIYRESLYQEKIQENIKDDTIMIDVSGKVVGQVNGLSVYSIGDYMFGRPMRITAKTGAGSGGIINIEREVELSGPIHSKGVYILSGYLRDMYAENKPITVSASLCFEQSYSGVEGDSASSTELYAILSSLSDIPIRQDISVTGSVNQNGEIQPIGGINEKIEGFFDVCKAKGFTGTQGVIIPEKNVEDLMLRKDVLEAVKGDKFHIYSVNTINDGIEILTGMKASNKTKDGIYNPGTIHCLVDKKLEHFAGIWKKYKGEIK
ncbi:AAA family ATPase [candidate division WOR-3 bacterium]|nr:AAA family ATPase [candidate division WOR-3 bacterium]